MIASSLFLAATFRACSMRHAKSFCVSMDILTPWLHEKPIANSRLYFTNKTAKRQKGPSYFLTSLPRLRRSGSGASQLAPTPRDNGLFWQLRGLSLAERRAGPAVETVFHARNKDGQIQRGKAPPNPTEKKLLTHHQDARKRN